MSWCCEGFQLGTPLRQPAPATPFVPFSLHRFPPGPTLSLRIGQAEGDPPPHTSLLSTGPAATAICSRAGGRTTPPPRLGQPPGRPGPAWASAWPRSVGRNLAPLRQLWLPQGPPSASGPALPQPLLLARAQNALWALLATDPGVSPLPN